MRELNRTDLITGKRILKEIHGLISDSEVHLAGHECSERLRHIADEIAAEIDRLDNLLEKQNSIWFPGQIPSNLRTPRQALQI
jgi:hypothetical protein